MLFQWLPGSLIWSLEPSEDLDCKDVTRAVSLVAVSAWLFERLRRFGWSSTIPIYLFCWGWFFFPAIPTHPKNPELLCVMVIVLLLFIGTSITIQGSDFPQAAWKFPRDSQREIPPVVGSYSEQHQAALQKRGGVILRVVWGELHRGESPDSWICL